MENREKLEAIKQWLTENGYKYKENYESKACGVTIDLAVGYPRVAVKIANSDDAFFQSVKRVYSPFFIRDEESAEFVIEKMANCLAKAKELIQQREENRKQREAEKAAARQRELECQEELKRKKAEALKPKRKRVRIPMAEKVTFNQK